MRRSRERWAFLLPVAVVGVLVKPVPALADTVGFPADLKLLPSEGTTSFDRFGWAAATSGDPVVVGLPFDHDNGTDSGSVHLFEADGAGGWSESKLLASDGNSGD